MSNKIAKLRISHRLDSVIRELEEVSKALEEARALGDLSENTEYEASLQSYTKLIQEKANLEYQLENIPDTDTYSTNIGNGTLLSVKLENPDGTVEDLGLLMFGDFGSSLFDGVISPNSPLGRAIRGGLGGEYIVQDIRGIDLKYIVTIEPESRLEEYLEKYPPNREDKINQIFGGI